MKIRTKILTGYFLIFTVTILIGSSVLYFQVKETITRNIENELSNSSATLMEVVRTAVNVSIRNRLRAVAEKNAEILDDLHQRAERGEFSHEEAKRRAVRILLSQRIGKTGYIYCLDSEGRIKVHPVRENLGRDVSSFEFVQAQKARREGYLEYYWKNPGEETPRPKALYMTYFEPWDWIVSVSTYREEFRYLVDIEDFRSGLLRQRFGEEGYAVVLDTQGNALVHPFFSGNLLDMTDADGEPIIADVVAYKFGKKRYWWQNPGEDEPREKLMIFNYLPEVGWIVGATGYVDDFYAPLYMLQWGAAVAVPLVLLLGLPFSLWVGTSISRSLAALRKGFDQAEQGDFTARVPAEGSGEMAQLGSYFNEFMQRMQEFSDSLRREVRDRKQAEEREARARASLQGVVDSMPFIVVVLDRERTVTLWNRRAAEEFGIAADDALGRPFLELCPASQVLEEAVNEALRENRHVTRDKVPGRKGGRTVYTQVEVFPLWEGEDEGVVVRIATVTDRVRMEEVMVQTEKMMSVGGLAAGMAHEINNPLGGILQGVQNVLRRVSREMPANRRAAEDAGTTLDAVHSYMASRDVPRILEGIQESGLRAARIVSNMLDFSRRSESERALCDLEGLVEKAVELAGSDYDLKKRYDFKKIKIQRETDGELPPVSCSATEIEQVFLNLLRNAAQAMADMPEDRLPVLRISLRREGNWARVEISDNGPGMDAETRRRIFEPFFTTKDVGEGTGLGLSVSYFIITRNHGGTFAVESEPGQGSTFLIRLPL